MKKAVVWCCLIGSALLALSLAARADEDGQKLLRELADAYKAADSLSYDMKVTQPARSPGAEPMMVDAKVAEKKPCLARVEVTSKAEGVNATLVCDGSTVIEYDPTAKVALKSEAPGDPAALTGRRGGLRSVDLGAFFSDDPYAMLTANSVDVKALEPETMDGVECSVVSVDYGRYKEKLWLGQDDHMIRKSAIILGTPESGETEAMSTVYTNVQVDPTLGGNVFMPPDLPEGTKVIAVPKMKDRVIVAGEKAPEFTVKSLDGKDVSLSDYKGKILLIDFWASWCGPCKMTIPKLKELHDEFKDKGLTVIGLDVWDQEEAMKKAIDDMKIDYTVLYAPRDGSTVDLEYGVEGIPTVYLIDKDGVIRGGWIGADPAHEEAMKKALADLGIK
jgi:cytochrome c biogenesis protein CcmG/thiol:disulfide interchange protein DsbE